MGMSCRPLVLAVAFTFLACAGCERAPSTVTATPPPPSSPAVAMGEGGIGSAATTATPTATATATVNPSTAIARPAAAAAIAILRAAVAVEPAARLPLVAGSEIVVHPAATFEVELAARTPDARLVLVDAREDLVPASGTRELAAGTRLTLAPSAPLVPGSRYALRLDGAADRDLHDESGRAFAPVTLPLLAAGVPPPLEPKKPVRKRRHR
jgi:hypothetical protein